MRNINNKFYIFSTFKSDLPREVNLGAHENVKQYLEAINIPFKEVQGFYKNTEELSIVVIGDHESLVQDLASQYGQESYLFVDQHGFSTLHKPNGEHLESLGVFTEAKTMDEIVTLDSYTYSPETKQFYYCK